MKTTRTIVHSDGHTDVETYMKDADGVWIFAVTQCNQEKQAMTYATPKTTITTREYLQRLSDNGYTFVGKAVTIQDILFLYAQIDALEAEVKNLDEGAKLMHSLATGGESKLLKDWDLLDGCGNDSDLHDLAIGR